VAWFKHKATVVEAWHWVPDDTPNDGPGVPGMPKWLQHWDVEFLREGRKIVGIIVKTLEGRMRASPGDWIVRGVKGELYPIKDYLFKETYEPTEETMKQED